MRALLTVARRVFADFSIWLLVLVWVLCTTVDMGKVGRLLVLPVMMTCLWEGLLRLQLDPRVAHRPHGEGLWRRFLVCLGVACGLAAPLAAFFYEAVFPTSVPTGLLGTGVGLSLLLVAPYLWRRLERAARPLNLGRSYPVWWAVLSLLYAIGVAFWVWVTPSPWFEVAWGPAALFMLFMGCIFVFWAACKRPGDPKHRVARCQHCGYDLRGSPGPRCPECGELFEERAPGAGSGDRS
jgi:hypothetical protein